MGGICVSGGPAPTAFNPRRSMSENLSSKPVSFMIALKDMRYTRYTETGYFPKKRGPLSLRTAVICLDHRERPSETMFEGFCQVHLK
jgi:hypothetical protein